MVDAAFGDAHRNQTRTVGLLPVSTNSLRVGWHLGGAAASREALSKKDPKDRHTVDVRRDRCIGGLLDFIRIKTPSDHMSVQIIISDRGKHNQARLIREVMLRARNPGTEFFNQILGMSRHKDSFLDLVPMTLKLQGKPMDVAGRRPLFAPLFRREKKTRREIYKCARQVSKTTNANAIAMMDMVWREMFRTMYVVPLAIYATRLHHIHMNPMIRACRLPTPIQDRSCVNNVNEKTFTSGSHYHGVSCFNSAGNALGVAIDRLIYDEVQDLNLDFIPQIRETLRTSEYRWESYFGTARGMENTIQVLFDESSGGEWVIRCGCGLSVIPTKEFHAISMIQRHGVACPKCSRLLNVAKGEWVHAYPSRLQDNPEEGINGFAGYHIPATVIQDLITPYDRYLGTIYDKLYGLSRYSEAKFLQEVLGISSDQGGRPITAEEIRNASILNFGPNGEGINLERYVHIGGGQDWGGGEVTSFTIGTLLGLTIEGKFECLGAIRPTGIPDNERHLPMAAWFRKIGRDRVSIIGGDAGFVGSVQNRNLESSSGIMVAHIAYGTQKHFFKPVPMSQAFVVDRTTLIYVAYTMIRNGLILFPKGQWFETFSEDLKATYIEDTESPTGIQSRRSCRYKQKADDFLHALGYALFVCAITAPSPIDLPSLVGLGENFSMSARTSQQIAEIGEEDGLVFAS